MNLAYRVFAIVCLLILNHVIHAATIAVKPGDSIQKAVDKSLPGDIISLAAGLYVEAVHIEKTARADAPITIIGGPQVKILNYKLKISKWQKAEFGEGIYKTKVGFKPSFLSINGLFVLMHTKNQQRILEKGSETKECRPGYFNNIKGVWTYMNGHVYFRTPDKKDPNTAEVLVAEENSACVLIENSSYIMVKGIHASQSDSGIIVRNSSYITIDHCTVGPVLHGIRLYNHTNNSKVLHCSVTTPAVFEWSVERKKGGTICAEDIFYINKPNGPKNRRSISLLNAGTNNEIAYNYIADHFQGVEAKEDHSIIDKKIPYNENLNVHHNTIERVVYYGLAPNGSDINGRWHHNRLENCIFRLKMVKTGPLYIYNNYIDRGLIAYQPNEGLMLFYNNLVRGTHIVHLHQKKHSPHLHILSNVFVGYRSPFRYDSFFKHMQSYQIDYNLVDISTIKNYETLCKAGYQKYGVSAKLNRFKPGMRYTAARGKGPQWSVIAEQLRKRYPNHLLGDELPGIKNLSKRSDIGADDDASGHGVDPALCGAGALQ